jgi:hypothetical protein
VPDREGSASRLASERTPRLSCGRHREIKPPLETMDLRAKKAEAEGGSDDPRLHPLEGPKQQALSASRRMVRGKPPLRIRVWRTTEARYIQAWVSDDMLQSQLERKRSSPAYGPPKRAAPAAASTKQSNANEHTPSTARRKLALNEVASQGCLQVAQAERSYGVSLARSLSSAGPCLASTRSNFNAQPKSQRERGPLQHAPPWK